MSVADKFCHIAALTAQRTTNTSVPRMVSLRGRRERIHGLVTDGDYFAFLVRTPEVLEALKEVGLEFYEP